MGYTHYWYRPTGSEISAAAWQKICADAIALVAAARCKIVYEFNEPKRKPQIDESAIHFNGCGKNGHETMSIERVAPPQVEWRAGDSELFDCCKTARKPYDRVVCGMLACIAEHDPAVKIRSDGDLSDWEAALAWASKTLKRKIAFPIQEHLAA